MMKHKIISILAAAAAVLMAAACNKITEEDNGGKPSIAVSPETLVIPEEGGQATITFTASDYWFASCPEKWVTIDPYSGKPGNISLTFSVAANPVMAERSAVITVNVRGKKGQVKLTQDAATKLPGPDYSGTWTVYGTIDGGNWDKDFEMTSTESLVWKATIPYHAGEEFKFRMDGNSEINLGEDVSVNNLPSKGLESAFIVPLAADGANIKLPGDGFWNLTLDLNTLILGVTFAEEFPPEPPVIPDNLTAVWEEDGTHGAVGWNGTFRFGLEGNDPNNECVATFPEETWNRFKTETFYVKLQAESPMIRVTNGWWDVNWKVGDIVPGNNLLVDNGDGTFILVVNLADDPDFVASLDEKHLLLTGDAYTPIGIYFEGGSNNNEGHLVPFWEEDGTHGAVGWNGTFRFGLEGHDGNNECVATFPEATWNRIKTETFYLVLSATNPQIRVTNGWWDVNWKVGDVMPGNELLKDNGDGTFTLTVNLADDPDLVASLDEKHLLFTGDAYTPVGLYFMEAGPQEKVFWENDGSHGAASWDGVYRFGLEGHDGNNECIATIPQAIWDIMMTQTIYLKLSGDSPQIRVTNGWWDVNWAGDIMPGNELLTENSDGTYTLKVNLADNPDFVATLEEKHLLFTGSGYTPLALSFFE